MHLYKPLALLALLESFPSTHSVLFLDTDTAFCGSFDRLDEVEPETYLEISPQASLIGTQDWRGTMLMNSEMIILKNTRWTRDFLALWWYGRCGHKDQLSLLNVLYATWSAWTTLSGETTEAASTTSDVTHWAYPGQIFYFYKGAMKKLIENFRQYGHGIQKGWEAVEKTRLSRREKISAISDHTYEYLVPTNTTLFHGGEKSLKPSAPLELPHVLILPPRVPVSYNNQAGARVELPIFVGKEDDAVAEDNTFVHSKAQNSCSDGKCWPYLLESSLVEDIDNTTNGVLGCGVFKCAFRSKRSRNHGYLVTPLLKNDDMKMHHDAFAFAHKLNRNFGIEHSLLGPPLQVRKKNAPGWLLMAVHNHTSVPKSKEWRERKDRGISSSMGDRAIVVQPILLYSSQSLLFKCRGSKHSRETHSQGIEKFDATTFATDNGDSRASGDDDTTYADRLRRDLNYTARALKMSKHRKCLSQDFQLVIDPQRGRLVHIDLDRCFGKNPMVKRWSSECRDRLADLVERIIEKRKAVLA